MQDREGKSFENRKEQTKNILSQTTRTRALNDQFRRTGGDGRHYITPGIQGMGLGAVLAIRELVANYAEFTKDNDPYDEHDFGALTFRREKIFWKIDYYDLTLTAGSPDPSNPAITTRVLTIMLAQEY